MSTTTDHIATFEVRRCPDGRWQLRVCLDGHEVEKFEPVDTFDEAKRMADDLEAMAIEKGARKLPTGAPN